MITEAQFEIELKLLESLDNMKCQPNKLYEADQKALAKLLELCEADFKQSHPDQL